MRTSPRRWRWDRGYQREISSPQTWGPVLRWNCRVEKGMAISMAYPQSVILPAAFQMASQEKSS